MKVITGNPVIIDNNRVSSKDMWCSLDGKSSTTEVRAFQDWMDAKHPNWVNGSNLNKGSGYGTFGPSTSKAWASYGTEYSSNLTTAVGSALASAGSNLSTSNPKTGETKKGMFWDKAKGVWVKAQQSGLLNQLGGLLGGLLGKNGATGSAGQTWTGETPAPAPSSTTPEQPGKQPMSMTTKVLIGVGVVAVLGVIIYVATKKNSPSK